MIKNKRYISYWPLYIILFIAGLVLFYNIDKPFWGHHDWNGVFWGDVARNFSRGNFTFNFHYPPFFPLMWSGFFATFGVHNWVSRIFSASFSLGAIIFFYKLVEKFFSQKIAVIASLFWIATPMFIYFGKMPVHEIPLMFFVLGAFYFYLINRFLLASIFSVMAMMTTWPGFFIVPAITFFERKNWRKVIPLWVAGFLIFGGHLLHDRLVTGNFLGGGLREIFLLRISNVSFVPYITTLIRWAWTYFFLLIPLSFVGLLLTKNRILILFLTYAIFYPLIFRDAAFRHDYLLIYFWPFFCLASALVIKRYLFMLIIIGIMLVSRWNFILALENSDIYKESVRFGQYIHDNSLSTDKVLAVTADPTVPWDGWFIGYYADRVIVDKNADKIFYYNSGGEMSFK